MTLHSAHADSRSQLDARRALDYAKAIARPRMVGSSGERQVAQEISQRMASFGYLIETQRFHFSTALNRAIKLEILLADVLIIIALAAHPRWSGVSAAIAPFLALLMLSAGPLNRAVRLRSVSVPTGSGAAAGLLRFGKIYQSRNIVGRPAITPEHPSAPHLLLVAHFDSKSQPVPLLVRMALFVLVFLGSALFTGLILLEAAWARVPAPLIAALALLVIASSVPLLLLQTENKSPGAIDNASGVGLLLALAEYVMHRPERMARLDLSFLFTSAEEFGALGATAYVRQNQRTLRTIASQQQLYVLNLDGTGLEGKLRLAAPVNAPWQEPPDCLAKMIASAAAKLGLSLGRATLAGALMDHIPFAEQGFDAASLITTGRASLAVHTPHDTADKLDIEGFSRTGSLVLEVIEHLSKRPPGGERQ